MSPAAELGSWILLDGVQLSSYLVLCKHSFYYIGLRRLNVEAQQLSFKLPATSVFFFTSSTCILPFPADESSSVLEAGEEDVLCPKLYCGGISFSCPVVVLA